MPDYRQIAAQKARRYGVPVDVFLRQINQESGFNPTARSSAGAQGIAQFIPSTARQYGVNVNDPVSSLDGAARYDAALLKQNHGNVAQALSSYNSGNPNAYKDPNFAHGQTYNYVRSILGGQGGAGAGASSSPAPAASTAPQTPTADPRQLLSTLTGASQGGDYTGFYRQLGQAKRQPSQPPVQGPGQGTVSTQLGNDPQATTLKGVGGIAKTALTQLGTPYQWGGTAKLGSRTDCSGLLQASARANGIQLGRTTYQQYRQGSPVALNQLQPGDAVFSEPTAQGPGHVAIYIGGGRVVEDPHTGASVRISTLAGRRGIVGARRYG